MENTRTKYGLKLKATLVYDINTDLESWKYADIVFDKEAKEADGDTEVRKEKLLTGV